jgi:hypothetical protein
MGLYDNPSVGKFEPPAGSDRHFAPTKPRPTLGRLARVGLLLFTLKVLLEWYDGLAARRSLAGAVAMLALFIAEWVIALKRREAEGHSPYRPDTHVTR